MIVLFFSHDMIEIGRFEKGLLEIFATSDNSSLNSEQGAEWVRQNCKEGELSILFGGSHAYCCSIRNDPKIRSSQQAVGFAVEEQVPLAAEKMEARITNPSSRKTSTTAVASEHGLAEVVNSIRQHFEVTFVGYTPLLAFQAISKQSKITKANKDYHVLLEAPHEVDLLKVVDRSLADWQWLPASAQSNSLDKHSDWSIVRAGLTLPVVAFGEQNPDRQTGNVRPEEIQYAGSYRLARTHACETLQKIIAGQQEPTIDLPAIPGIGERSLNLIKTWFFVGMSMLLLGFTLLFVVRTQQVEAKIKQLSSEIDSVYRDAYPDGPNTPLKQRTLNARLSVLQEAKDFGDQLPPSVPFTNYLKTVLTNFPEDTEAEIRRFEMRPNSLMISGFVPDSDAASLDRRFGEASFIATSNKRNQQSNGKRAFTYMLTFHRKEAQK